MESWSSAADTRVESTFMCWTVVHTVQVEVDRLHNTLYFSDNSGHSADTRVQSTIMYVQSSAVEKCVQCTLCKCTGVQNMLQHLTDAHYTNHTNTIQLDQIYISCSTRLALLLKCVVSISSHTRLTDRERRWKKFCYRPKPNASLNFDGSISSQPELKSPSIPQTHAERLIQFCGE